MRHDANIINHAGIVRGSIQRATKLALCDTVGSARSLVEVTNTIDGLMGRFLSGEEGYRHRGADEETELLGNMRATSRAWRELKEAMAAYRLDRSEESRRRVVKAGDDVLLRTAGLTQQSIRKTDGAFRIGGDEFAVLLPETNALQAFEVAEKIRKAVERHPFASVDPVTITAGVSEYESDMTVEALHCLADNALYQAKQAGRNRTARTQAGAIPVQ